VAAYPGIFPSRGGDIYDDIIKALDDNGELDDTSFRRLVLFALVDLGKGREEIRHVAKDIKKVDERVKTLEKFTILIIASKHPKITCTIIAIVGLFTLLVISRLELWVWISEVLSGLTGVPLP
jgi:hypothetical protein